jgi:hypothetical protein
MGYAKILGGGEDGRYDIELDFGKDAKDQILAALGQLLSQTSLAIGVATSRVAFADSEEAELRIQIEALRNQYAIDSQAGLNPSTDAINSAVAGLGALQAINSASRRALATLKLEQKKQFAAVAYWNSFSPISTRSAWCCDFTESAPVGSFVATKEIPGDSSLVLIAPGAPVWDESDGILTATEVMSPSQAFLAAALLPGWQKFKPTHRWGTLTAINRDAHTASVSLFDQRSAAQSLPVNQSATLSNVPIQYMTCNSEPFELGDRVVVEFIGQDWNAPRIIGFLDNPKPCEVWPTVLVDIVFAGEATAPGVRDWVTNLRNSLCGITGTVAKNIETAPSLENARIVWQLAAFETSSPGYSISASYPSPHPLGDFSFAPGAGSIPNSGRLPQGASPARRLDVVFSAGEFLIQSLEAEFSDIEVVQYSSVGEDLCVADSPETAPYFTLQPIGAGINADSNEVQSLVFVPVPIFSGRLDALTGSATISVTLGDETREYELSGFQVTSKFQARYRVKRT